MFPDPMPLDVPSMHAPHTNESPYRPIPTATAAAGGYYMQTGVNYTHQERKEDQRTSFEEDDSGDEKTRRGGPILDKCLAMKGYGLYVTVAVL